MSRKDDKRRIPYVEADDSILVGLFDEISALRGRVLNLHRALAHRPDALRAFMVMSRYVRDDSSVPKSTRELVILAVAAALENDYELAQHLAVARSIGISAEKVAQAMDGQPGSQILTAAEAAAVKYAQVLAVNERPEADIVDELGRQFDVPTIVDITLTIGWYRLCDALTRGLEINPEGTA